MDAVKRFIRNEIVLCVAFVLAVISAFVIHPDKSYFAYIDYRTLSILLALMITMAGFQKLFVFRSHGNTGKQIAWYVVAFCIITCIVNSINCIWIAVAGLLVPDWIYNIGTTVLNGGVSMVIFFFVNKVIFPSSDTVV